MVVVVAVLLFGFFTWLFFSDSGVTVIIAFLLIGLGRFDALFFCPLFYAENNTSTIALAFDVKIMSIFTLL